MVVDGTSFKKIKTTINSLTKVNSKAEIIDKPWEFINGSEILKVNNIEIKKEIKNRLKQNLDDTTGNN